MKNMLVVGLTGRSGSGKSSVGSYYASQGYPVVDGDAVSRQVTEPGSPCLAELAEAFGPSILAEDGTLRRRELAELAFATKANTARLNSITHPHITAALMEKAREAGESGAKLFFVDGAAIVGEDFEQHCDHIIVVVAEYKLSISRIILRDGISKTAAAQRLAAQLSEERLVRAAGFVIQNNGGLEALHRQADAVLQTLLKEVGA